MNLFNLGALISFKFTIIITLVLYRCSTVGESSRDKRLLSRLYLQQSRLSYLKQLKCIFRNEMFLEVLCRAIIKSKVNSISQFTNTLVALQ